MDIKQVEARNSIRIQPASSVVRPLISKIHQYEQIYHMRSAQMLYALRNNKALETKDVCNWMHDYRTLKKLRNGKNGV